MKTLISIAVLMGTAVLSLPAAAQFAKAEDAIEYRQGAFRVMAHHFSRLGAMANGKAPYNAAVAAADGDVLAVVSKLPQAGFVAGSDKGKTRALPDIWKEEAKFKDLYEKMVAETAKVATAAKSGSLDQLKASFGPAAQSCKACHDEYRAK
ncbi:MAG: cytochrome c [Proteobacteria bacterium]|jgi:cytochrome c556|nr:cytochrome c [Pseudomonadota bacterium]